MGSDLEKKRPCEKECVALDHVADLLGTVRVPFNRVRGRSDTNFFHRVEELSCFATLSLQTDVFLLDRSCWRCFSGVALVDNVALGVPSSSARETCGRLPFFCMSKPCLNHV